MTPNGNNVALKMLDEHEQKVNDALKQKKLSSVNRVTLEGQILLVSFMREFSRVDPEAVKREEDLKKKVDTMWKTFRTGYRLLWILIPITFAETIALAGDLAKWMFGGGK